MNQYSTFQFEGAREDASEYLKEISGRFYVYVLFRPNGVPFYVGKGLGRRALEHELEALREHPVGEANPYKCNVIRKIVGGGEQVVYRIDSHYSSERERECLQREAELIETFGRLHEGGPLTNLAGGMGATSGAAPASLEKHSATLSGAPENNPERATLNSFLQSIGPVASVPIKPVAQISRILPTLPHPKPRSPTQRCAFALIASAVAHGLTIEPGVRIPRTFVYTGVEGIIENGVARDLVKAGMAELIFSDDPRDEQFELSERQCRLLVDLVGRAHLNARGLLAD
ncbi:GIY-YIG nuclease family protein [Maritimibacter sp. HL-12]|uniref:GIY-YIG nuclease family protein n=1 Tax=Maritimibacter sp. HL-12 TaxID=1162418 RepID=UPI000A0F170D|nr:GIY-YIG nuclease family protein [Maritimibacter sp. HL-12]SMH51167.1 hypothetical protein SAMN05661107_2448 [Maritimibacter sp. HL-12]